MSRSDKRQRDNGSGGWGDFSFAKDFFLIAVFWSAVELGRGAIVQPYSTAGTARELELNSNAHEKPQRKT